MHLNILFVTAWLLCWHASEVLGAKIGVGLGFGKSSQPYPDALNTLKNQGIRYIKTWSINPVWLHHVQVIYGQVTF